MIEKITSERHKVLDGIISQSQKIIELLGDCKQKPSLKNTDIQRGSFDTLFYHENGIPKTSKELEEIKKQHVRNIEWCINEQ